jgi:hypothetical protein
MKIKTTLSFIVLFLFAGSACYAEPPGAYETMALILLLVIIVIGTLLGFIIKLILMALNVTVSNWLIFLSSIILTGIFLVMTQVR